MYPPHPGREDIAVDKAQANYLGNVLRLADGDSVLIFNGSDGEWLARVAQAGRRVTHLSPTQLTREQPAAPDLLYLFAPLKHARLDYMVQRLWRWAPACLPGADPAHAGIPRQHGAHAGQCG